MNSSSHQAPLPADTTKPSSSRRLLVLLALLVIMVGALGYDRYYAGPGKEAAKDRIDKAVESKVFAGMDQNISVKDKATLLPTDADIQQAIGFSPKWTKKDGDYTLQCFHWWGWIPLNRNFLVVRYRGTSPLLFVDYGDGQTPQDNFSPPLNAGDPSKASPAGPGMGGSGGEGQGKGGKKSDDAAAEKPEPTTSEDKSSDTPPEKNSVGDKPDADTQPPKEDKTPKSDE